MTKAVRWRLIKTNPLRDVDPPHVETRDIDTLTANETIDYLKAFTGHELEPLIVLIIATGCRPCELYGLRWPDISFDEATVKIERGKHQNKTRWRRESTSGLWRVTLAKRTSD